MQKLLLAGFLILLLGIGLIIAGGVAQGGASAGGVVFIGPFPIVFGVGPYGANLALISVVIGGIMLVLVLLWGWGYRRRRQD